jgi:hypothetical protein
MVQKNIGKNPHSSEPAAIMAEAAGVPVKSCAADDTAIAVSTVMTGAVKLLVSSRLIVHIVSIASLSISLFNLAPPFVQQSAADVGQLLLSTQQL